MKKELFGRLLNRMKDFRQELDDSEREKDEYLDFVVERFDDSEERFLSNDYTLEDFFYQMREQQEYEDGGWRDIMLPDVDENGEEYPDDYDPYENEAYHAHSELLNELEEFLQIDIDEDE